MESLMNDGAFLFMLPTICTLILYVVVKSIVLTKQLIRIKNEYWRQSKTKR